MKNCAENKRLWWSVYTIVFLAAVLLVVPGNCQGSKGVTEKSVSADEPSVPPVILVVGGRGVSTELAISPRQQMKGLMYRKSLPDNSGMLFFMPLEMRAKFWMKNTYIPLSIAFIDSNWVIQQISEMKPLSEDIVESKSDAISYCLEMNSNWFELNKVKVGDHVVPPPELDQILQQYRKSIQKAQIK